VSLGLALIFTGISHYQGIAGFIGMVSGDLGFLGFLGTIWAYILPLLMIVGGVCLIWKKQMLVGAWCSGLALASIPAGMLLKPVLTNNPDALGQAMSFANNAFIWIIVLLLTVKMSSCCGKSACATGGMCACGGKGCEKCKAMGQM
jgi:hypothetical protein